MKDIIVIVGPTGIGKTKLSIELAKKLDAEISALSTEYDTVKNLISKSIEKTFTMFSS